MEKIKSFTDLFVWQEGHKMVIAIYNVTKNFPKEERFSLTDQMRRAATSVTSNIAEGFGRQGYKEKVQFYHLALGSLTELENQIYISRDIGYLNVADFEILMSQAGDVHRLLNGIIKKSKEYLNSKSNL